MTKQGNDRPVVSVPMSAASAVSLGRDDSAAGQRVIVELFDSQIDQILRSVVNTGGPSISALLSGLASGRSVNRTELEARYRGQMEDGALSRSLFRGFIVLACFLPGGLVRGIAELSKQLELNISTTHRYVSTLVALGLLEQCAARKYRLARGIDTTDAEQSPANEEGGAGSTDTPVAFRGDGSPSQAFVEVV